VGTRLITSQGQSALDGVYKLVAVIDGEDWIPAIKISENPEKIPNPGHKHVWRVYDKRSKATADVLSLDDENLNDMDPLRLHHPTEYTVSRSIPSEEISYIEPLLEDIYLEGDLIYTSPSIEEMRQRRLNDLEHLDPGVRRIMNPHIYHVSLTQGLWDLKQRLASSITKQSKNDLPKS
jgi:nicotinate phosphoribosyltransferase